MSVPAEYLLRLPDSLDFVDAAPLFCGGITMYGGFKSAGLRPDQRVAVLGIGGLGHLGIQIAKAMGAEVVAITSAGKEDWARELGADHVIARNGDAGKQLLELGGADVIISTSVEPKDISSVLQGLRIGLDSVVGNDRTTLIVVLSGVGLVLLIICVNLANRLFVRADGRHR
jgi:D-arabinose 1-dehydrogenase-like Zn-dependent alcohol dehydrogenase